MTPFGFVFLTLMFGVIVPSPTDGKIKIKMTFRQAMEGMKCSSFENSTGVNETSEEKAQIDAFCKFMGCLDKLGRGLGKGCNIGYLNERMNETIKKTQVVEDIPLKNWERIAALKCMNPLECYKVCGTCCPSDFAEKTYTECFSFPECPRNSPEPGEKFNCETKYAAFQRFSSGRRDVATTTFRSSVSISKSGWWTTFFPPPSTPFFVTIFSHRRLHVTSFIPSRNHSCHDASIQVHS